MWNDERVGYLKARWADGYSASVIAKELGDVTRNAVIGKAHRLGLQLRGRAQKGTSRARAAPRYRQPPKPVPAPILENTVADLDDIAVELLPLRVWDQQPREQAPPVDYGTPTRTFQTLQDGECKFPIGDPKEADFGFCGGEVVFGQPYCGCHSKIAFEARPISKRQTNYTVKKSPLLVPA